MGTPDFAVTSLKVLIENNFNIVCVVTAPDKPAGRGQKINQSAVKKFAIKNNIPTLQPVNLKDIKFQEELKSYNSDIQIIVAFRMLPKSVWNMPRLGSINLHASLLPNYRGAAPINWAIINGEKETGVTTFFLKQEIDTGDIIFQEKIDISPDDNAEVVHDNLMITGANLLVKTIQAIIDNKYKETPQTLSKNNKPAPKIYKADCLINWNQPVNIIHNFIRGLSPYPTAWASLKLNNKNIDFKVFKSEKELNNNNYKTGTIVTDNKNYFKIATVDGFISILELQLAGKKRMLVVDFLKGFKQLQDYTVI